MAELSLTLDGDRFEAGGVVRGVARAGHEPLRVRLWWAARADGGAKDWIEIAHEIDGEGPELPFELDVPSDGPVSFRGALVDVEWCVTVRADERVEHVPILVAPAPDDRPADVESFRADRERLRRDEVRTEVTRGIVAPALRGGLAGVLTGLVVAAFEPPEVAAACALAVAVGATALAAWQERRGRVPPSVVFEGAAPVAALGQAVRVALGRSPGRQRHWRLGWTEAAEQVVIERRRGSRVEHRPWREHRHVAVRGVCDDVIELTLPRSGPTQVARERRTIAWWIEVDEAEGERSATIVIPIAVTARVTG